MFRGVTAEVQIDASKLAAEGLRLSFDGPRDTTRHISLAPSNGVSGRYASDSVAIVVEAHSRENLSLDELSWTLESGDIALRGNAALVRPVVSLTIPRGDAGMRGEVAAGELSIDGLTVTLDALSVPLTIDTLRLHNAGLALDGRGGVAIVAEEVTAERIALTVGGTEVVIDQVTLAQMKIRRPHGGSWQVEALALEGAKLALSIGALGVVIEQLQVGRVQWEAGGDVSVADIQAPRVHVDHTQLSSSSKSSDEESSAPKAKSKAPLDLSFLDRLDGKLDVDLTADSTVPVIGTRRATHHFRLKVEAGTINYYRLEKGLSKLEDALLDFEVRGDELVLVVDLALTKKPVVAWPLAPDEVELAQRRLVRLRRLWSYEIPTSDNKGSSKSSFEIHELAFDNIDIALGLAGGSALPVAGGRVVLGSASEPAIASMTVTGNVCHRPKGDPQRGKLTLAASDLLASVESMTLGSRTLDLSGLRIGAIADTELRLAGVRPESLRAHLRELSIGELRLARSG